MNPRTLLAQLPCLAAAAALFFSATATAQTNWAQVATANLPSPRADYAMAQMPPSFFYPQGSIVLYGGRTLSSPYTVLSDTWVYDIASQNWGWFGNSALIGPRVAHAMTYDPAVGAVVMYGGCTGLLAGGTTPNHLSAQDSTFVFTGNGWGTLPIAAAPVKRFDHAMCYDPIRGRVVLTAGRDDQNQLFSQLHVAEQTMTLYHDFATTPPSHFWTALPTANPSMGGGISITYDEVRQRVVMVGQNANYLTNEIWELPSNPPLANWNQITTTGPNLVGAVWQAQYDVARDRTVIVSSTGPANGYELDGTTLKPTAGGPVPTGVNTGQALLYDPVNKRCFFYNGQLGSATWHYQPTILSNVARLNSPGCVNSNNQIATLAKAAGTEWQSENLAGSNLTRNVLMSNLIPGQAVQLMASFGLSSPTPTVTFANGCQQWLTSPASFPIRFASGSGTALEAITFPPGYAGTTLYYQFVTADPNAQDGFVLSNVLSITAGSTL